MTIKKKSQMFKIPWETLAWLEDQRFLVECLLGLESFGLESKWQFEAIGIEDHGLPTFGGSEFFKRQEPNDRVKESSLQFRPGYEKLTFWEVDQEAVTTFSLAIKGESSTREFFGKSVFKNLKTCKEEIEQKEQSSNEGKSHHKKFTFVRIRIDPSKVLELDKNFSLGNLLNLSERELKILTAKKHFNVYIQKIWKKFEKKNIVAVLDKLGNDVSQLDFVRKHSSFVYLLLKIDFTDLEKKFMLYGDYVNSKSPETNPRASYDIENEEKVYKNLDEYLVEVRRLRIRQWFIKEVVIKNIEYMLKNGETQRFVLKILKDDLLVERVKTTQEFQQVDVSSINQDCQKPNIQFNRSLKKKVIPKETPLLDFLVKFVKSKALRQNSFSALDHVMATLFDFTEIKLVSFRQARMENRTRLIRRLLEEDSKFIKRFEPIIRELELHPSIIMSHSKTYKSLAILLTKLNDGRLFNIFFRLTRNLGLLVSSKNCNYIVQEIMTRISQHRKGQRELKLILEEIEDPQLSKKMKIRSFTYEENLEIVCCYIQDQIKNTILDNFKDLVTQKYAKYVIAMVLQDSQMMANGEDGDSLLKKLTYKAIEITKSRQSKVVFTSETGINTVVTLISITPLHLKLKLIRACGKLLMENIETLTKTRKIIFFIGVIYKYYRSFNDYIIKFRKNYEEELKRESTRFFE